MKINIKMFDFLNHTWAWLIYGGLAALASVIFVAVSAHKKAKNDSIENQKYIQNTIDSSVKQTINEFENQLSVVLDTMNNNAKVSLNELNNQGEKIISNLQKDVMNSSKVTLKNLQELQAYSEKLKLEKPVYLSLTFAIDWKYLPSDVKDYHPVETQKILKEYVSSINYELIITRLNEDKINRETVAVYSVDGKDLVFDNNPHTKGIFNSLSILSVDFINEIPEYTINLKLSSKLIGDFISLEIGDNIALNKRIQNTSLSSDFNVYKYDEVSDIKLDRIYLTTSFSQKYELKYLDKFPLGMDSFNRFIGGLYFEIVKKVK